MTKAKKPVIQVRVHNIIEEAVTSGISYGLRRINKHEEIMSFGEKYRERIIEELSMAIMNQISEVVIYPEDK